MMFSNMFETGKATTTVAGWCKAITRGSRLPPARVCPQTRWRAMSWPTRSAKTREKQDATADRIAPVNLSAEI
jgi:hypothetical protein